MFSVPGVHLTLTFVIPSELKGGRGICVDHRQLVNTIFQPSRQGLWECKWRQYWGIYYTQRFKKEDTQNIIWVVQTRLLQSQTHMKSFQQSCQYMSGCKTFSYGCYIPIRMHQVLRSIGMWHNSSYQISILCQEVDM